MRAVLYTHDLIPITIMKLEGWMVSLLDRHGSFRVQVDPPMPVRADPNEPIKSDFYERYVVRIDAHRIRNGIYETYVLTTDNEEGALLIKAAFLPGQTRELNEVKEREFARGFFAAIVGM